jgi:hypothetical protein
MLILEMSIRPGRLDIAHQENRQRLESGEAIHNPSSYQLFGMDLSNAHSPGIISVGVKLKFCCIVRSRPCNSIGAVIDADRHFCSCGEKSLSAGYMKNGSIRTCPMLIDVKCWNQDDGS